MASINAINMPNQTIMSSLHCSPDKHLILRIIYIYSDCNCHWDNVTNALCYVRLYFRTCGCEMQRKGFHCEFSAWTHKCPFICGFNQCMPIWSATDNGGNCITNEMAYDSLLRVIFYLFRVVYSNFCSMLVVRTIHLSCSAKTVNYDSPIRFIICYLDLKHYLNVRMKIGNQENFDFIFAFFFIV